MKTAAWIIGALAALFAVTVDADGVCYDPDRGNGLPRNVAGDMAQIKAKGFTHVRTYISDGIAEVVAASGLRSMLGIPYEIGGSMDKHIEAAKRAVKSGEVDYIMVGNENLRNYVPDEFIKLIRDVKSRIPGVRVGTVQRSTEIINMKDFGLVAQECDVIGVNIHPFFTNLGAVRKSAIDEATAQWNSCKSRMNSLGKPLILTETGWPTAGSYDGNDGSKDSAQAYWNSYKSSGLYGQLADSDKYYFQFFDTLNKQPEFEQRYGLFNEFGGDKLSGVAGTPATPAPTTPAPTTPSPTTPAATTSAPTTPEPTTVAPASNSTSGSGDNESDVAAGLGSASAGSDSQEVGDEDSTDLGIATLEDAATDLTQAPTNDGTIEAGGNNNNDDTVNASTQSSSGGSNAGLVVVIMLGVAAVGGAFAFIYKARQKAAEMERSESKSFDVSVTPGGACVL